MATSDEEFIKQLREVFDLCDELKCGIISVGQLRDIVEQHFGGTEEVSLYFITIIYFIRTLKCMLCKKKEKVSKQKSEILADLTASGTRSNSNVNIESAK